MLEVLPLAVGTVLHVHGIPPYFLTPQDYGVYIYLTGTLHGCQSLPPWKNGLYDLCGHFDERHSVRLGTSLL